MTSQKLTMLRDPVTCDRCGRRWGYLEGEILEFKETKEIVREDMSDAERAVWDRMSGDEITLCGACFDKALHDAA